MPPARSAATTASEPRSLIWTTSAARILIPTKGEDERDRLVDVAEAAHEDLDQGEQRAEPEKRERVSGPDHDRVARHRERRRDRDDRNHHQQQWRAVETAAFADEQPAPAEVVRGRKETPDKTEHGVRCGVGRFVCATQ